MRTIRTTMQPDIPITVEEAEYRDLLRQGLVLDDGTAYEQTVSDIKAARKEK